MLITRLAFKPNGCDFRLAGVAVLAEFVEETFADAGVFFPIAALIV